jgi:hypothetical protein
MNFKQYLGHSNHFITRVFMFVVGFFTLISFTAYSNEDSYQLTKIAQLEHRLISKPNWQQLVANPSNKRQHFVIRESGQVYLVDDDKINPQAILDMRVSKQKESALFKLTAIELHPNFSLRDHVGYSTFYTAHIETINKNSKTKRVQERGDDLQLNFDAVITEWQFSAVNHQKVDMDSKREVLRIGVPDKLMVIKQISFSPYLKLWNDDFGLLYIALNGDKKWPQPLYSGVVLRIDPTKFGLRGFSIPKKNPYIKNSQINNTIYLLGAQGIAQFIWPDKNSEHILVSHQYNNEYLLSLTDGRNDWRNSLSKQVLYQSDDAIHDMLMYQGRELPLLRSKLLLLREEKRHWFIESLALNFSVNKKIADEIKPQLEWPIASQQLPINSKITLSSGHYDEILLLEKSSNVLFHLTQQALVNENVVVDAGKNNRIEKKSSDNNIFILLSILLIILVLLGTLYYCFWRNSHSVKTIVRQQFASTKLNESCQKIGLYHRHQRNAETIVDIVDIVSSEIKLNKDSISVINAEADYGFDHDKEQHLRTVFFNERVDKMVDGKIRQISLLLTDNKNNNYTVCLYMRKGGDRITKKSYAKVIDELIDWCWFIGEAINVDETDKREPLGLLKKNTVSKLTGNDTTLLHNQAAAIRVVDHKTNSASQPLVPDKLSSTLAVISENNHSSGLTGDEINAVHNKVQTKNRVDTELINALEKLVNLKEQGFLTTDEFSQAKEKLLKDLFKK